MYAIRSYYEVDRCSEQQRAVLPQTGTGIGQRIQVEVVVLSFEEYLLIGEHLGVIQSRQLQAAFGQLRLGSKRGRGSDQKHGE